MNKTESRLLAKVARSRDWVFQVLKEVVNDEEELMKLLRVYSVDFQNIENPDIPQYAYVVDESGTRHYLILSDRKDLYFYYEREEYTKYAVLLRWRSGKLISYCPCLKNMHMKDIKECTLDEYTKRTSRF